MNRAACRTDSDQGWAQKQLIGEHSVWTPANSAQFLDKLAAQALIFRVQNLSLVRYQCLIFSVVLIKNLKVNSPLFSWCVFVY